MPIENTPQDTKQRSLFAPFTAVDNERENYLTRNEEDKKLDITELFSHFTADIIRQDTPFTR